MANYLKIQTGSNNLCIAGGVGLNCVANGVLMKKDLFKNIFVQPAANDAGTALGAAFIIQNQIKDQPRSYVFNSPYLGPEFSDLEIKQVLDNNELSYNQVNNVEAVTAKLIADGNIIAWFQGAMEIGPRALGNRSILADPRKKDVVTLINNKVKHREAFRPFCPSVLKEKVSDLFDLDNLHAPLSYMLAAVNIKKGTENIIPAVTHIDGTSRIQAVCEKLNPRYHKLISEFNNLTGVPVLLNTSFNNQEPIVCTPNDAIKTFQNTRIDYLVMGSFIVKRI